MPLSLLDVEESGSPHRGYNCRRPVSRDAAHSKTHDLAGSPWSGMLTDELIRDSLSMTLQQGLPQNTIDACVQLNITEEIVTAFRRAVTDPRMHDLIRLANGRFVPSSGPGRRIPWTRDRACCPLTGIDHFKGRGIDVRRLDDHFPNLFRY